VSRAFFAPRCGTCVGKVRYIGTNQIVPAIVAHGNVNADGKRRMPHRF